MNDYTTADFTPRFQPALNGQTELATERSWRRWWHTLCGVFCTRLRALTPLEAELRSRVAVLEAQLAERDGLVLRLRTDLDKLEAAAKVHALEVCLLTGVLERDRLRVQAETAGYATQAALQEAGRGSAV